MLIILSHISDQLKQHYADCIKLSTENKINAKNAFGLHLLEYIDTILQEKSDNFQVNLQIINNITRLTDNFSSVTHFFGI